MPLFQKSVLNKYLKEQDKKEVLNVYQTFKRYFHNPTIQQNIIDSKEEQFQEGFLRELFVKVFGYTLNPNPDFNYIRKKQKYIYSTKINENDNALANCLQIIIEPTFL